MLYDILRPVIKVLLKIVYKVKVTGLDNLPGNDTSYIISGNHIHIWDPVLMAVQIKGRHLHFMAKDVLFKSKFLNWFLHKVIDKPNIDQKELLEATVQYRKLLIPDLIIKGVGLILSLILYPPIMMYSVLIAAFYIITLKTLSEKRVNN